MSGKNNINPDHYKVAGRDRPNEGLAGEPRLRDEIVHAAPAKGRPAPNFIPGALPVGEAPPRKRAAVVKPTGRGSGATRGRARGATPSTKTPAKRTGRTTGTTARRRQVRKRQAAARGKRPAARPRRRTAA